MATLTELLKDYRNSIERALAGHLTNKTDAELSNEEVENAADATQKVTNLQDYIDMTGALDNDESETPVNDEDPDDTLNRILQKYNIRHMSEAEYVDRDVMMKEGFKYFGVFEDEKLCTSVTKYLDENEIEYMDDGSGHIQMRFGDRDSAYRVEEHIARMVRKSNPHFMRDHEEMNEDNEYGFQRWEDEDEYFDQEDAAEIDGEYCDLCGHTGYEESDMTDCPHCREYYCPEHDDYDGCPHCGSLLVNERAPGTNKDGSPIDSEDDVPDNVISFAEFRKQHPELKNHARAKRAYKSWAGTQKAAIGEDQLDEFIHPFNRPYRDKTPKDRFAKMSDNELQALADRLSKAGAPQAGRNAIHKELAKRRGEDWVEESDTQLTEYANQVLDLQLDIIRMEKAGKDVPKSMYDELRVLKKKDQAAKLYGKSALGEGKKKKAKSKERNPAWKDIVAKRQSGAAGAHTEAKYTKADRRNNKLVAKQGVDDE